MSKLDMSREAILERLRLVGRLSDLSPGKRLDAKLDMTPAGVEARLKEASDLYTACLALAALGRSVGHER